MAIIRTFKAFRPEKSISHRVAALPYDVYNRAEAREEALKDSVSFLNIDRPETQFPEDHDMYAPDVYRKAKEMLEDEITKGVFLEDSKPCYYIYELTMNKRSQTGIVACASIDDYLNGVIKKHENTRADKELDRIKHVDTCSAQTGPIFLAYRRDEEIEKTVKGVKAGSAVADFTSEDGITHRVWVIDDDKDISVIRERFGTIDSIYIADGHHRAASAVKVGLMRREKAGKDYDKNAEYNFFLSVLFPENELMIMPYNRVVKDLNGYSKEGFLEKISEKFEVEKIKKCAYTPSKKLEIGMYLGKEWYKLTAKKGSFKEEDPVDRLDVSVLQNNILLPVLGIDDPKTDKRIDFVGGIRGVEELERRCESDMEIAFSMYPTSINELFDVADAGLLMPPKSTWFEPKLRSGLFIHRF